MMMTDRCTGGPCPFADHFAKLPVRVLPSLLSQAGLHDASALLCKLPSDFASVRRTLRETVKDWPRTQAST